MWVLFDPSQMLPNNACTPIYTSCRDCQNGTMPTLDLCLLLYHNMQHDSCFTHTQTISFSCLFQFPWTHEACSHPFGFPQNLRPPPACMHATHTYVIYMHTIKVCIQKYFDVFILLQKGGIVLPKKKLLHNHSI